MPSPDAVSEDSGVPSVGSNSDAAKPGRPWMGWTGMFGSRKGSANSSAAKSQTGAVAGDVAGDSTATSPATPETTGDLERDPGTTTPVAATPIGDLTPAADSPGSPVDQDEPAAPVVAAIRKASAPPLATGIPSSTDVGAMQQEEDVDNGRDGTVEDVGEDGEGGAATLAMEQPRVETARAMPTLPKRSPTSSGGAARPAGMGGGLPTRPAVRPSGLGAGLASRSANSGTMGRSGTLSPTAQETQGPVGLPEEPPAVRAAREKLLQIRLTMLRAASRLEIKPGEILVQEFMNRVDTAERVRFSRAPMRPPIDTLFQQALDLEQQQGAASDLGYDTNVLVLGPAAVGKTSLIQNILAPDSGLAPHFATNPTKGIATTTGQVCGLKMTFIDTPGLRMAASLRRQNMVNLRKIKAAVNRYKPQIVMYVDRMDVFRREFSDLPLLRLINDMSPNMLYSCIPVLTHANAPPPDGTHGEMPYNEYYRMRLDAASQIISHGIQDMRWGGRPVGFENHPGCRVNSEDVPVLPNGLPFKRNTIGQLITSRLFKEVENIVQINRTARPPAMQAIFSMMGPRKQLQLSALVAQLLQSKAPRKFPEEERDLKSEAELQLMDERTRMIEEQKRRDYVRLRRVEVLQEEAHPSQVPVVGQKMDLNPSFDHDVNTHRYNATDFVGGWSVRPIISQQDATYDHDEGIEMFQVAREGVVRPKGQHTGGLPGSMIIQASKQKGPLSLTMESSISCHSSKNIISTAGCIIHPAGGEGELVYTPSLDVRVKMHPKDKVSVGVMATRLSEDGWPHKGQLSWGAKVENKLKLRDGLKVNMAAGGMTAKVPGSQFRGDSYRDQAYGANIDVKIAGGKGEYDPSFMFGAGVSNQKRGSVIKTGYSGQASAEVAVSPETMLNGSINMNASGTGTLSLRAASHDKPVWGWVMVVPLVMKLLKRVLGHESEYV
ncbi:unnamed protein product [Ostreobium quekettii]|uniref:Translocase of chloroplast 159/132 membrane anchor domain-containing protein n=1 Tax=Ostreobium quekettii TaxID=121088 RepID=A0A8S1IQ59_9CHLO|nr:unnamed protein product [Ostreobium quekettii]